MDFLLGRTIVSWLQKNIWLNLSSRVSSRPPVPRPTFMFTGLIEELGLVPWIRATERGTQLQIAAPGLAADIRRGDSMAI